MFDTLLYSFYTSKYIKKKKMYTHFNWFVGHNLPKTTGAIPSF